MYLKSNESKKVLRNFGLLTLRWAEELHKIQKQAIEAFGDVKTSTESDKDFTPLAVNGAAYFAAIADLAQNLHKISVHLSRECNRLGGYQIDLGELDDVFEQQQKWNHEFCDGIGAKQTRKGHKKRD